LPMLSERLERRLPLLTGGGRDRPLRLQTMRDAIDWSHQLLSPNEQVFFRRVAVFAGGFTLEAAEQLWSNDRANGSSAGTAGGPAPPSALALVAALVDASLLHAEPDGRGTTRYRMLETIRDFAAERLAASGEEARVRDRHADCFAEFAERHALV